MKIILRASAVLLVVALAVLLAAFAAEGAYRQVLRRRASRAAGPGAFELYAVGESSMKGLPFGKSAPDVAGEMLGGVLAGRPLRVINLAEGGNSVYPQAIKAIRTLKYRDKSAPAAVLIYAGHSEQMNAGMRCSRALRLYEAFKEHALIHSLLFSKVVLRAENYFSFHGVRDLAHYEFYLRAVLDAAREAGAVPVLATLPSNLCGAEPGGAQASPELAASVGLELRGQYAEALARYAGLLNRPAAVNDSYLRPYLEYRAGRCLQALGRPEAGAHLLTALETDPLQFRARPSQNALIRGLAADYPAQLVDAEKLFARHSPGGLPGSGLFVDLMHPDETGYLLLARAFAEKLAELFHDKLRKEIRDPSVFFEPPFSNFTVSGRALKKTEAYTLAGTYLLWFAGGSAPLPDQLALAERNFSKAIAAAPGNTLARTGLRIVRISKKNGQAAPAEVAAWFRSQRPVFERLQPLTEEELGSADAFLRKWE